MAGAVARRVPGGVSGSIRRRRQKSIWVQVLMAEAKKRLSSILEGIEENRKTAVSPGGPYLYDEALASDQQMVEELIETESFDGMVRAMAGMKFKGAFAEKGRRCERGRKIR